VKRLQKELLFANSNPDESIKLFSNENNLTSWKALIKGIETLFKNNKKFKTAKLNVRPKRFSF
jgi:ubiquitin-protein ligase